jgi:hypothetical protein
MIMGIERIANQAARGMVKTRRPFEGSHLFAREHVPEHQHTVLYVVYSYGEHFPLFVAETDDQNRTVWYENADRYSVTTSKHRTQTHPHFDCIPMTTQAMRRLARDGIAGLAAKGELQ